LAHAFYPRVGDLHFDEDETFTTGNPNGIDFKYVAVHEMGHSFGLAHSNVRGAIMQPYFHYMENLALHADDIAGIQAHYGTGSSGDPDNY
jgi:hypothetical protein